MRTQKIKPIFSHPSLFQFCAIELLNAESLEFPLEAIERIHAAINLTQQGFELAFGGAPQADEMTPLLNYVLLTSGLSKMVSFQRYLDHFLCKIDTADLHLLDERKAITLTHFINHVSSLDHRFQPASR
jgi:hypothetical protein